MAKYDEFPTHLGGPYKDHNAIDLTGSELVKATWGSHVKAAAYLELAIEHVAAAQEQADLDGIREFSETAFILEKVANLQRDTHPGLIRLYDPEQ